MNYPVDTGIPAPKRRRQSHVNYGAIGALLVGNSMLIPESDFGELGVHAVAAGVRTRAARMGIRIRTEVRHPEKHNGDGPGLRVWRE